MGSVLYIDFLGNRRSAVLRRIFCAGKSVSSAALLGVMQGRDTKPGAEETSKTVLRKFPRKSIVSVIKSLVFLTQTKESDPKIRLLFCF